MGFYIISFQLMTKAQLAIETPFVLKNPQTMDTVQRNLLIYKHPL